MFRVHILINGFLVYKRLIYSPRFPVDENKTILPYRQRIFLATTVFLFTGASPSGSHGCFSATDTDQAATGEGGGWRRQQSEIMGAFLRKAHAV